MDQQSQVSILPSVIRISLRNDKTRLEVFGRHLHEFFAGDFVFHEQRLVLLQLHLHSQDEALNYPICVSKQTTESQSLTSSVAHLSIVCWDVNA